MSEKLKTYLQKFKPEAEKWFYNSIGVNNYNEVKRFISDYNGDVKIIKWGDFATLINQLRFYKENNKEYKYDNEKYRERDNFIEELSFKNIKTSIERGTKLGINKSAISELISIVFPFAYIIYDEKIIKACAFLDIEEPKIIVDNFINEYEFYSKNLESYSKLYDFNFNTNTSKLFEFGEFLFWVYEEYARNTTAVTDVKEVIENKHKKLTRITIKNFHQFEQNLEIDLTYPEGHSKAGQPLDKICIIGQSATGKTSILSFIKDFFEQKLNKDSVDVTTQDKNGIAEPFLINFPPTICSQSKNNENLDRKIVDFSITDPKIHWNSVLERLKEYKEKYDNFNQKSTEKLQAAKNPKERKKIIKKLDEENKKWEEANPDILEELDGFFKNLLERIFLRVNQSPESIKNSNFIPIERYSKEGDTITHVDNVPLEFLSTGTKQILMRSIPLFSIKPENSIILIDEPENSFYPDVQKAYVDFIVKSSPTCQFFFATHSPTIASSFDPWEIVELRFNEEGKVYRKKYFNGDKPQIKNYYIYPKYLRWDKIFTQVFNIEKEGDNARDEKLQELAELQSLIDNETDQIEKNKLVKEFQIQAKKLGWDIHGKQN